MRARASRKESRGSQLENATRKEKHIASMKKEAWTSAATKWQRRSSFSAFTASGAVLTKATIKTTSSVP